MNTNDVLIAVRTFFSEKIKAAHAAGINDVIILDPGFGFGKNDSITILRYSSIYVAYTLLVFHC